MFWIDGGLVRLRRGQEIALKCRRVASNATVSVEPLIGLADGLFLDINLQLYVQLPLRVSCDFQSFSRRHTMAKTFATLTKEIDALKVKAEAVRRQEGAGVIARIKVAIDVYGLTAADLGFSGGKESTPKLLSTKVATAKSPKPPIAKGKSKLPAKYRDSAGNSWTGRGSKPRWLTAALAAGQSLETLKVRGARTDAASIVGGAGSPEVAKSTAKPSAKADGKVRPSSVAKYRDAAGNSWGGRGPKPRWVKAALAAGRNLEELAA